MGGQSRPTVRKVGGGASLPSGLGDSKGPIRLKGLFVFGAVTLGLGYAVPIAGSAAGPPAALGAGSAPSPVASAQVPGALPRVSPGSQLVGYIHATEVMTIPLDFTSREVPDPNLPAGTRTLEQVGVSGTRVLTIDDVFEDGYLVEQRTVAEKVVAAVEQVSRVGTRAADPPAPPPPAPPPPTPAPVADPSLAEARAIAGSATSYCLTGRTATGTLAGPGAIAVDPAVIPLGSHLFVPGYGYGWAVDTGSAIRGTLIDVWLDCGAATIWGRRQVTIYVLPN